MDAIVTFISKLLSNPEFQPLLQNLKKQNEQFYEKEKSKLLANGSDDDDDEDERRDEELGGTGKEMAMGMLKKLSKMFQFASVQDKAILLIGTIATIIHAASFPILAILFGRLSNVYIAHKLLEMQNTTLHPHHNASGNDVGATGKLALSFLTKVASNVQEGANASIIPTEGEAGGGTGYFGNFSFYNQASGNETTNDFAADVADFSVYYFYIGLGVLLSSFLQTFCWEWVAEQQVYRLRLKFVYQVLRQDMTWFTRYTAGSLVLKLSDDCERFREGVGQKFSLAVEYISIALFGAGIGFITNSKLTLVFLACAPFILTKLAVLWKTVAEKSETQQREYAKAGKICSEVLTGMKGVTSNAGELKEISRYEKALAKGAKAAIKKEFLIGIGFGGMYLLIYSFYAIALWYAVNLLAQGVITAGEVYTIFFSLTICTFAIGSVLPYANSIATSFGSIKLLEPILENVPKIDPYSLGGERPKKCTGNIKFSKVSFGYPGMGDRLVFNELNLEIPSGKLVAIVGGSSSGKSTLVNLLLRFFDPSKGQIKIDSHDLKKLNVRWIRQNVDSLDQNAILVANGSTILQNICARKMKVQNIVKSAKLALAHDFIMELPKKYETKLKLSSGKDLTIGQRQRIAIAKCLIKEPKVLVLDSAMSAINFQDSVTILKNLQKLREGLTTIFIAQKVAVAQYADLIFVLKDGKVAEEGVHEELMEYCGTYFEMVQHENLVDSLRKTDEETEADAPAEAEFVLQRELATTRGRGGGDRRSRRGQAVALKVKEIKEKEKIPPIKRLLEEIPHKSRDFTLGFIGCILSGIVIPMLALCLGQILVMFLGDKDDLFASGIYYVEVLVLLAVIAGVGYCLRTVFIGQLGENLATHLRSRSYHSIIRQPISWFDEESNNPGFLYARLASDIPFVHAAVGARLGTAITAIVTLLTGLLISMVYGWELAFITCLIIPILFLVFYIQDRIQHDAHLNISESRKKIGTSANSCIKNIWNIQAKSIQLFICQRLEVILADALRAGQKRAFLYGVIHAISECLMFFTFAIAFRVGAELIRHEVLSIPDLFTIFFVITFGSLSLGQATSFIPDFVKARVSSAFVIALIDTKSTVDPLDPSGIQPEIKGQIEFRNVTFSYPILPEIKILNQLNLIIPQNSSIGIVGPVGGGKSTILSIIERFYEIDGGEVLIDGVNINEINLTYLRRKIGYVSDSPVIFDRSIRENILYGYYQDTPSEELTALVEKAAMAADADFITEELPQQYETKCGEQGRNLNPGQRQEIAIARAIIKEPAILLFDDPTSLLDAEEAERVHSAMYYAIAGRTSIVVSNSYATVKYCEYIAVLVKGKIVEYGKQKELLETKGIYYQFIHEQGVRLE